MIIFDCLWWVVVILIMVGYGDIYLIILGGKLFMFLVLMVGLGMIVVFIGIIVIVLFLVR